MAETLPQTKRVTANSTLQVKNRQISVQFGNGYSQVTPDGLNANVDVWSMEIAPASGANLIELNDFFTLVGVTEWFTWIPLGELVSKKFRIKKDTLRRHMINTSTFRFTFTMEQVFDLGV